VTIIASPWLLLAKLALVVASVLGASLVARRWGHAAGGRLAGLPVIAGPIIGLLLIDLPADRVRDICVATLQCQPALMAYLVLFALMARRFAWPVCLIASFLVYLGAGAGLLALDLPETLVVSLAVVMPALGQRAMPRSSSAGARVELPGVELVARLAVALAIAAAVLWGANHLPAGLAGLLLAAPIAGVVLPCFTLSRNGSAATAGLLAGFARGQHGFVVFFVVLVLALPLWPAGLAWAVAVVAAAATPWFVGRFGRARQAT
jgi:hypothetical protein